MAEPTDAPAEAPRAPESETVQNINPATTPAPEAAQVPDMHGFTSEQLADIDKFFKANGGFDAIKSKISNPQKTIESQVASVQQMETQPQVQPVEQPQYRAPEGSITPQEFLAQQYFQGLSRDPRYQTISEQIASGEVLKEMSAFNIKPLNQDGSINDTMVRRYLDLKAQTVPAKPTETEPNSSAAPTVDYVDVGEQITSLDQAYQVLMQPGHPKITMAEEFIKKSYNPNSQNAK